MDNVKSMYNGLINMAEDQYTALEGADCLAIITEWSVFRTPNFERVTEAMNAKVIFDGRNLYDLEKMSKLGYYYDSIGRSRISTTVNA